MSTSVFKGQFTGWKYEMDNNDIIAFVFHEKQENKSL